MREDYEIAECPYGTKKRLCEQGKKAGSACLTGCQIYESHREELDDLEDFEKSPIDDWLSIR